jgi:hypothetical protein
MRLNFGDKPFKYQPSKAAEALPTEAKKPVAAAAVASKTKEDGRFRPIKVIRRSKPTTASAPAAAAFSIGVAASAGANSAPAAASASPAAAAQVVSANASSAKPQDNA